MNTRTDKMTRITSVTGTDTTSLEFVLSDASTLAENALSQALAFTAQKMGLDSPQAALDCLRQCNQTAFAYLYYSLATQVAEWAGSWDEDIKAVYLYDYDAAGEEFCEAGQPTLMNLIVWARRKTSALNAMMEAADRALTRSYNQLLNAQMAHLLDAQLIDDDDVTRRTAYGALLSSLYYKPVRIWKR